MYSIVLLAHAAVGVFALAAYWTAGLARKGSPLHRAAGRLFSLTMLFMLATALLFVGRMLVEGQYPQALFFGYLIVISGTALATGWLSLRWKKDPLRYHGRWYRRLAGFNLFSGAGLLAAGIAARHPVEIGFSLIGLLRGGGMLRLARAPARPRWWLQEHLGSMIGNGVAVHVAFLLVGLNRLLPPGWQGRTELIGWLLPVTVAAVAGAVFSRRYGATTGGHSAPGAPVT